MPKKLSEEGKKRRKEERALAAKADKTTETVIETVAPEAAGVPIQELQPGQRFELDSDLFVVKTMGPEGATAAKLEWAPGGGFRVERWQRPVLRGTLVVPKE